METLGLKMYQELRTKIEENFPDYPISPKGISKEPLPESMVSEVERRMNPTNNELVRLCFEALGRETTSDDKLSMIALGIGIEIEKALKGESGIGDNVDELESLSGCLDLIVLRLEAMGSHWIGFVIAMQTEPLCAVELHSDYVAALHAENKLFN